MGVDTRACCMLGIAFDSFEEALNHLLARGKITEDDAKDFKDRGEIDSLAYVEWQIESCYSGSGGVLGWHVDNFDLENLKVVMAELADTLGEGNLEMHNFVYWY